MQLVTGTRALDLTTMSTSTLTTRSDGSSRNESFSTFPGNQFLLRRIGVEPREQRCPHCNSLVYTRRHKQCGVCERVLPVRLLLSDVEAQRVDILLRTERQRHRAWLKKNGNKPGV